MKNIFRLLLVSVVIVGLGSCEKSENKDFFEGGTAPSLSASAASVALEPGTESNTALTLNWTNPNFMFTTGVSSQNVSYTVEIDTAGGNFASANKKIVVIPNDLSKTFTVGELNAILGNDMQLQLNPRRLYNLQIRVVASISGITNSAVQLASNTVSVGTTPFAPPPKVTPPSTGELFITGDATDGGWMVGGGVGVPLPNQEFTQVSPTVYTITVHLVGGKQFLLLPVNGDWGNKYAVHDTGAEPVSGGDFGYNGGNSDFSANFPGPASDGTYKITVDFQRGVYTITQ